MPSSYPHRNLPMLLLQARETVMQYFRPQLKRHGLTEQQWRVIRALDEHAALDIGEIARLCSILGPSLTGVLARMENAGLVVRSRSAADQRRVGVRLTPKSRRLIGILRREVEERYRFIEKRIGRDSLDRLYALLDEVNRLPAIAPEARHPSAAIARRSAGNRGR